MSKLARKAILSVRLTFCMQLVVMGFVQVASGLRSEKVILPIHEYFRRHTPSHLFSIGISTPRPLCCRHTRPITAVIPPLYPLVLVLLCSSLGQTIHCWRSSPQWFHTLRRLCHDTVPSRPVMVWDPFTTILYYSSLVLLLSKPMVATATLSQPMPNANYACRVAP